jgi:hypothetical protein
VIRAPILRDFLAAIADVLGSLHSLNSCRDLCGSALLQLYQRYIPQRVQVFFPAIESHLNTVAAAIFRKPGMKRLVNVTDDAGLLF